MKRLGQIGLIGTFLLALALPALGQKVKFGNAVKVFPPQYLPVMAAEEKGIWKQNGLEVEWSPFASSADHIRAVAGRSVDVGLDASIALIPAIVQGVPAIIISNHLTKGVDFRLWVNADSPIREPKQLRGAKIGVFRLGAATHAYARVIAEAEGIAKDVRYVGTGGARETVAALRAGAVDAVVMTASTPLELYVTGQVRVVVSSASYFPKEWVELIVLSRSDFARNYPEVVKRVLRAVFQSGDFVVKNSEWSIEKMKSVSGYSDRAAKLFYEEAIRHFEFGKIERKALENVMNFLTKYGLVPKEKATSADALYTEEFLQ